MTSLRIVGMLKNVIGRNEANSLKRLRIFYYGGIQKKRVDNINDLLKYSFNFQNTIGKVSINLRSNSLFNVYRLNLKLEIVKK
jgi:hypothetical protein